MVSRYFLALTHVACYFKVSKLLNPLFALFKTNLPNLSQNAIINVDLTQRNCNFPI